MLKIPKSIQNKLDQYVPLPEQEVFIFKALEEALKKFDQKNTGKNMYNVYTDGGARGNPGPAGCGAVILNKNGEVLQKVSHFIKHATNNEAEYTALLLGVKKVLELKPQTVNFYLDSELIVKQMNGEYKIKKAELKSIFDQIQVLIKKISQTKFVHIPRTKNQLADQLVNQAINQGIKG